MDSSRTGIYPSIEYRAETDAESGGTVGAQWAVEGLDKFRSALASGLGLTEDDVAILSIPEHARYISGICAGTVAVKGNVVNVAVFDGPGNEDRTVRPLTPVML